MSSKLPYRPSGEASGARTPPHKKEDDDKPRRWDEPPEKEPPWPPENEATLLLVHKRQLMCVAKEAMRIKFSSSDEHIAVMMPYGLGHWNTIYEWNTNNYKRIIHLDIKVSGDFALAPTPDRAVVAPYQKWIQIERNTNAWGLRPVITIFDLERRKNRLIREYLDIQGPITYSPDGTLIAAVDSKDTSRITICDAQSLQLVMTIPHHTDEVTHLAFSPDGISLASLSKDGWARLTSVHLGRTLRRYDTGGGRTPKMLQFSLDGELVACIWGREVNLWYPETGIVNAYDLNTVRRTEGWPLCISPDCKYLACRTEDGFDVSDLLTGTFRGDLCGDTAAVTSAAFSSTGRNLVIGKMNGEIELYEVITVD
ncbi:guanine nucleotide-binding protein subunit beta-like protein [Phialemonium atrogriseum]|uniref:Guanine nucleotide-binding protein subunit beta-like protein n=1 Tax=Phialemonium atrogriseum TaxID=1093897 RepID=A0AAJ0BTK2_9PEZI|nr:guanine nucleotide-binding protein subunit beta-like protein [Phialemonium atrogriseum]KAK1762802.1 guanine nucleotide-binding protein subunit beta-like protein [Phialemonium atrogriseum]